MLRSERKYRSLQYLGDLRVSGHANPLPLLQEDITKPQSPEQKAGIAQMRLREVALEFETQVLAVERDGRLTEVGKAEKVKELAGQALKNLEKWQGMSLPAVEKKLADLETRFGAAGRKEGASLEQMFLAREVRDRLLAMDESERINTFWNAIQAGDALTVQAILDAPRIRPIVPDEMLAQGRSEWQRRQSPELAEQVEDLRQLHGILEMDVRELRSAIEGAAGIEHSSTLQVYDSDKREWVDVPLETAAGDADDKAGESGAGEDDGSGEGGGDGNSE
jgi:hypothetical protein